MKRNYLWVVLVSVLVLLPAYAAAKTTDLTELSIEELMNVKVSGVSRFEQNVSQAPAFVNIVTAADIRHYGYRTLAEILKSLPGFHVTYDRTYNYIGARGFSPPGDYNSRFLVIIDGHRENENVYDSSGYNTDFSIDIDLINKIEVIQGPGSSLYGSNAFFCVINITTKRGRDIKGTEIDASAGSFNNYKGRLTYGNRFNNRFEMLLSATGFDSKGDKLYFQEFDSPATNNGYTDNTDFDRGVNLLTNLSYGDFAFSGSYKKRTKGMAPAPWDIDFNSTNNEYMDERMSLDLSYSRAFSNNMALSGHISYDEYISEGHYSYAPVMSADLAKGAWLSGNLLFTMPFMNRNKLSFGSEYVRNIRQDQKYYDEDPYYVYLDSQEKSSRWALFFQDEITIFENLLLNAGVRFDDYSTFGGTINPRIALIYNPIEKSTVKLIYGSAFRAPNPYELYYGDTMTQKGNTSLKPEEIETYELICEQRFLDHYLFTGSLFFNKIEELITQQVDTDGMFVFQNQGKVEAKGILLQLEGIWANGWRGRLSYTYQNAKDADTGQDALNSPKHMAKLNLTAPLWRDKVFSGLELQYMSSRETLGGGGTDSFFTANVTIFSQQIIKGLSLSGSLYNIFNKHYSDPSPPLYSMDSIEQDGRTFRVKLTYDF